MAPNTLGTFFETSEGYTYQCVEGTISKDEGYSILNGAKQKIIKFANGIGPETFLRFNTTYDLAVENVPSSEAASGSGASAKEAVLNYATHICEKEPEWKSGAIPYPSSSATLTQGNYEMRIVTAYRLTTGEMELPLSASNSALKPGDAVIFDPSTGALDKATGDDADNSTTTCLETIAANKGGYVLVDLREPRILSKTGS